MADYTLINWQNRSSDNTGKPRINATQLNKMDAAIKDAAEHHKSGPWAAIPNPNAASKDWLYFATDRGVVYANLDGASWSRWSADAPLAAVYDFAALNVPIGFLECDGAAVSRVDYFTLFSAITKTFSGSNASGANTITNVLAASLTHVGVGCTIAGPGIPVGTTVTAISAPSGGFQDITLSANASSPNSGATFRALPYGGGDGSTTFNLPDFGGRSTVGSGAGASLTARRLGQKGGEEAHVLSVPEMPAHSHDTGQPSPNQNFLTSGVSAPWSGGSGGGSLGQFPNTGSRGDGQAHNNMQPFLVTRKIIKAF